MPTKIPGVVPWLTLLLFLFPLLVFPQCWPRSEKLLPEKAYNNFEGFGRAIDHENGIAVVGAPQSDTARSSSGVVYIFQFNGAAWTKIASLMASDHRLYQGFGRSVKISGDHIFVGDPSRDQDGRNVGAVYIFKKPADGWKDMVETSILIPTDSRALSFGTSIDIFENTLIVGAPYSLDDNNENTGAAYIFGLQGETWIQQARLSTSHTMRSTFGSNVAIKKNTAVVVASEETLPTYTTVGSTYVFEKSAASPWVDARPVGKLIRNAPEGAVWYLGSGLAVDEARGTIFITNSYYETDQTRSEIRVYKRPSAGWSEMHEDFVYHNNAFEFSYEQTLAFEEPYLYFSNGTSVAVATPGTGDEWTSISPFAFLENDDYHSLQRYGTALSVSNGHVLVSAPGGVTLDRDEPVIAVTPAVYEFILPLSGWSAAHYTQNYRFTYMPRTATDFSFGEEVDIDGDIAIVGSPGDNHEGTMSGAVYVYQLVNLQWKKIAKLTPSDGETNDYFGGSVAISKNFIAVSAVNKHYRDETGKIIDFDLGAVYIFERPASGWTDMHESYKLVKSDSELDYTDDDRDDDHFGVTIDMDYPYLVASRYDRGSRPNNGSVYVYRMGQGTATLEATLNPSTRSAVNDFGHALKISNNTIVVGGGPLRFWFIEANMVFVYVKNGEAWQDATESAVLHPSDVSYGAAFGYSIDMTDDASKIIIGSPGWFQEGFEYDATKYFKGAAYIYERPVEGWAGGITEKVRLTVPDQPSYGCMGVSVHIEDRYVVVGSPQNFIYTSGGSAQGSGRVYFYQMPDTGWEYKEPDKIIEGDEAGNPTSDYFGSSVDGVFGFLMIGAIADDNQNSVDAGSVYVYTEYPFIDPGQSPICENSPPVQLSAFPQGGVWSGSAFEDPVSGLFDPALAVEGVNRIKYRVDDCDASNTLLIDVKKVLTPFSLSPQDSVFFCGVKEILLTAPGGNDLTYRWRYSPSGSDYSDLSNSILPELAATREGFYKAEVSNLCSAVSDSLWVGDLHPDAGVDFSVCLSDEVVALGGNSARGTWSGGGVRDEHTFAPVDAGLGEHTLVFSVLAVEGCAYRDTVKIQVRGIPSLSIDATGEDDFCYKGFATLTATPYPDVAYDWYLGPDAGTATAVDGQANVMIANETGFYKVRAFDGYCTRETDYLLERPPFKPTINTLFDSIAFCQNSPPEIEAESIPEANYAWFRYHDNQSELADENVGSFATKITESGRYELHVASHGCEYVSPEMIATKIPADSVFVPNVITPNGDDRNDAFEIYTSSTDSYSLRIYDRYGSEVFATTNGGPSWRGNDSSGVYFWVLNYFVPCENRMKSYKGTLHVMK